MSNPITKIKTDSLAFSLRAAAFAVAQVHSGTALPQALSNTFVKFNAPAEARGAIQDISYRSMRIKGRTDALLLLLASKPPAPPLLHGLLSCALALLAQPEEAIYESFTVVDQAVNAAAADPEIAHAKGMVNAVLRRFLRERETLLQKILTSPEARWNYPAWWIDTLKSAYPSDWQAILEAGNAPPPLTLRVNSRRIDIADYLEMLSGQGMDAAQIGPYAVRLAQAVPVGRIPGFAEGLVSVQDAAAQLAAPLMDLNVGMRVLDACAAPGGKTGHMLEMASIDLTAIDHDAQRLVRVEQNLHRLELKATLKTGDAGSAAWWDGVPFDRILADVPCTASGIVRRHPDIRWLRRKGDALQLAALSSRMLDNLWQMLKPGGKLLFVTCSIWPQESSAQADAFAMRQQAIRLAAPGQLLPTATGEQDHDGLFYALFQKPAV